MPPLHGAVLVTINKIVEKERQERKKKTKQPKHFPLRSFCHPIIFIFSFSFSLLHQSLTILVVVPSHPHAKKNTNTREASPPPSTPTQPKTH
jgi:hypothetical protein